MTDQIWRCEALNCDRDGSVTWDVGTSGIAGWPLGGPSLRQDVTLLDGTILVLCLAHMRDLQQAIEMRRVSRRWVDACVADVELMRRLRSVVLADRQIGTEHMAALMHAARLVAARPTIARGWAEVLTEVLP